MPSIFETDRDTVFENNHVKVVKFHHYRDNVPLEYINSLEFYASSAYITNFVFLSLENTKKRQRVTVVGENLTINIYPKARVIACLDNLFSSYICAPYRKPFYLLSAYYGLKYLRIINKGDTPFVSLLYKNLERIVSDLNVRLTLRNDWYDIFINGRIKGKDGSVYESEKLKHRLCEYVSEDDVLSMIHVYLWLKHPSLEFKLHKPFNVQSIVNNIFSYHRSLDNEKIKLSRKSEIIEGFNLWGHDDLMHYPYGIFLDILRSKFHMCRLPKNNWIKSIYDSGQLKDRLYGKDDYSYVFEKVNASKKLRKKLSPSHPDQVGSIPNIKILQFAEFCHED